ncbi:MAG: ammonium transporter [Pseudanabaenaceae cyanobacterium bins.68]|nr:ammonium transporter [Pseudanabaenaceae cyanobacterium bins.68]
MNIQIPRQRAWLRLLSLAIGAAALAVFAPHSQANTVQELTTRTTELQISLDTTWVLLTGFLVFFMQTGFAILEAGLIRQTGVVNCLLENFIDAAVTAIAFWLTGFAIAFGSDLGGIIGTSHFLLADAMQIVGGKVTYTMGAAGSTANVHTYTLFFFQFAFAATASTITTGAMAERTDFRGDLIYSFIMGAFSYPLIVHWVWHSQGWLAKLGYLDFAGSSVVHVVGGFTALVGAYLLGARPQRVWDQPPPAHNLSLATLGTMILWLGWYGFNPGSTIGTNNPGLIGLVTINTTLAAGAGALAALFHVFLKIGKWHLFCGLNGSLAGLVAVTAGCAYIQPWAAVIIGAIAGVLVLVVVDWIESLRIDDPVGAFGVHGACGTFGTLAVGLFAQPELASGKGGLFLTGNLQLLGIQILGLFAIAIFTTGFAFLMFSGLNALNLLRVDRQADIVGIDVYEHGASAWPDIYPIDHLLEASPEDLDLPLEARG